MYYNSSDKHRREPHCLYGRTLDKALSRMSRQETTNQCVHFNGSSSLLISTVVVNVVKYFIKKRMKSRNIKHKNTAEETQNFVSFEYIAHSPIITTIHEDVVPCLISRLKATKKRKKY